MIKSVLINYLLNKKSYPNKFTLTYNKKKIIFYLNIDGDFIKICYRDGLDYNIVELEKLIFERTRKLNSIKQIPNS